jgi:hypothetical protein
LLGRPSSTWAIPPSPHIYLWSRHIVHCCSQTMKINPYIPCSKPWLSAIVQNWKLDMHENLDAFHKAGCGLCFVEPHKIIEIADVNRWDCYWA